MKPVVPAEARVSKIGWNARATIHPILEKCVCAWQELKQAQLLNNWSQDGVPRDRRCEC